MLLTPAGAQLSSVMTKGLDRTQSLLQYLGGNSLQWLPTLAAHEVSGVG